MSMENLRVGIIGCGMIANTKHMPSLKVLETAVMVGFCDVEIGRAEKAKKDYGTVDAVVCEDYKRLIENKDIDIIHVCTPNKYHKDIAIDAIEAGKHVMIEKPIASSLEDAKAIHDVAQKSDKKVTVGYQNRFKSEIQYIKRLVGEGHLGEIYLAKAFALRRRGVPLWGMFLSYDVQGGGPLIDIGCHALDLTLWVLDNYDVDYVVGNTYKKLAKVQNSVNNVGSWDSDVFQVEDSAFGFITMKNGTTVTIDAAWAINMINPPYVKCSLYGTKAGIDMDTDVRINGELCGKLYSSYPDIYFNDETFNGRKENHHNRQIRNWIDAILNDSQPLVTTEQALIVARITDAIYKSSKTRKPVYL